MPFFQAAPLIRACGIGLLAIALLLAPLASLAKGKTANSPAPAKQAQQHHAAPQKAKLRPAKPNKKAKPNRKPRNKAPYKRDTSRPAKQQTTQPQATSNPAKGRLVQSGKASYYNAAFHGRRTASGERYDQNAFTCAHGSLPFGCRIRVTNQRNQKSVVVKINDRGAFHKHGRVVDLSRAAAKELGMLSSGIAPVKIEVLD